MKGLCLSNSLEIRQIHNEFGNLEGLLAFGEDGERADSNGAKEPFHFIAFIHKNDKIYELDGLKEFPLVACEKVSDSEDWRSKVLEIVKKRVGDGTDIRFNLMALVADCRAELQAEISDLTVKIDSTDEKEIERSSWLAKRFKAVQELEEAEAKWARYRKDWTNRQKAQKAMQSKPKISSDFLSAQVQDLLKSMTAKGLLPK